MYHNVAVPDRACGWELRQGCSEEEERLLDGC